MFALSLTVNDILANEEKFHNFEDENESQVQEVQTLDFAIWL